MAPKWWFMFQLWFSNNDGVEIVVFKHAGVLYHNRTGSQCSRRSTSVNVVATPSTSNQPSGGVLNDCNRLISPSEMLKNKELQ